MLSFMGARRWISSENLSLKTGASFIEFQISRLQLQQLLFSPTADLDIHADTIISMLYQTYYDIYLILCTLPFEFVTIYLWMVFVWCQIFVYFKFIDVVFRYVTQIIFSFLESRFPLTFTRQIRFYNMYFTSFLRLTMMGLCFHRTSVTIDFWQSYKRYKWRFTNFLVIVVYCDLIYSIFF